MRAAALSGLVPSACTAVVRALKELPACGELGLLVIKTLQLRQEIRFQRSVGRRPMFRCGAGMNVLVELPVEDVTLRPSRYEPVWVVTGAVLGT